VLNTGELVEMGEDDSGSYVRVLLEILKPFSYAENEMQRILRVGEENARGKQVLEAYYNKRLGRSLSQESPRRQIRV